MTTRATGPYLGGKQVDATSSVAIRNPYDTTLVGEVGLADARLLETAIAGASAAFESWSRSATHERASVLEKLALSIEAAAARKDPRAAEHARRYLARYPNGRFRGLAERVLAGR
jgi:acyl-CoA reductase-like NAD-dependent aldehyde dehydrogenase